MKFTHLLAAFFLLFTLRLTAQSTCPLPAPTNLTNVYNDPTYIEYTFNPVAGATGYRVTITYPSGAPPQTFDINNPSANSCSATVLVETRILTIYPKLGNCISPNGASHISSGNIITVDLVSGYHEMERKPDVEHCSVPGPLSAAYCTLIPSPPYPGMIDHRISFKFGTEFIKAGLSLEVEEADKTLHVYRFTNPEGWVFNGYGNKIVKITKSFGVNAVVGLSIEADQNYITLNPINLGGQSENISDIKIMRFELPENPGQVTSANEISESNPVLVSPNPFNDNLTLTMEAPETGNVSVQLYNLTGGLQKSLEITPAELTNNTYTIPTADLATGMYIMQVSTEQGVRHTSKVFKL